jgi:methionyl-tRNA synthetase
MKFYITTAIDYVNASPHLGHGYEKITADVIARWHRLKGDEVHFLTGTDENAQKNAQAAKEKGMGTKAFVDKMAGEFRKLCDKLNISYDDFIRTTEERHIKTAQKIFSKIHDNGDIYKGKYSGLYCQGCEAFYTEKDLVKGKCPEHDTSPEKIEEENYFFKLSKYQTKLIEHIKENPGFIRPKTRRNEIVNRLKDPLKDVSITRHKVDWGIEAPFDKEQKIYVWGEALANYVTALGYPGRNYKKFWPADIHVVGTGINWFHSVIWPALLLSAKLKLPKQVFVHGYITHEGRKMSKSLGNVVDPFKIIEKYGSDSLRYFLIRDIPFGEDGDFSEEVLKQRINGELLSDLGNLVSRVLTLYEKNKGLKIKGKPVLEGKLNLKKIQGFMDELELHQGLNEIFNFIRACNAYINETEPWKKEGDELGGILYNLLEGLRVIGILVGPFLPETAEKINKQLGVRTGSLKDVKFGVFRGKPSKGKHLFEKVS